MPFWDLFVQEKCKNASSDPQNGHHFPRSRLFEVKFMDKMPLTSSNVSTQFRLNNQNRFWAKCKNVISDPSNGSHFPRSRSFDVKFILPSSVGITKIDLDKSAKMQFQILKMGAISRVKGNLKSNSQRTYLTPRNDALPLGMPLPIFFGITKTDWEKSAKNVIFKNLKLPPFRGILSS